MCVYMFPYKFCFRQYTQAPKLSQKSYFKLFLCVALGSVPLNNCLANVQQKHISKVEAFPAHLHLKQIKTQSALSTWHALSHNVTKPLWSVAHLLSSHSFLPFDMKQPLNVIGVGFNVLHAWCNSTFLKAEQDKVMICMVSVTVYKWGFTVPTFSLTLFLVWSNP